MGVQACCERQGWILIGLLEWPVAFTNPVHTKHAAPAMLKIPADLLHAGVCAGTQARLVSKTVGEHATM